MFINDFGMSVYLARTFQKQILLFISCLNNMLSELTNINLDKRSIEIFYDAIFWAKKIMNNSNTELYIMIRIKSIKIYIFQLIVFLFH